jgi:hypothetical protein
MIMVCPDKCATLTFGREVSTSQKHMYHTTERHIADDVSFHTNLNDTNYEVLLLNPKTKRKSNSEVLFEKITDTPASPPNRSNHIVQCSPDFFFSRRPVYFEK